MARYTESKHKRDERGRFSVGGDQGTGRRQAAYTGEDVLDGQNRRWKIEGRSADGRIVVNGDSGRQSFSPHELRRMPSKDEFANLAASEAQTRAVGELATRLTKRGSQKAAARLLRREAARRRKIDAFLKRQKQPGERQATMRVRRPTAHAAALSTGGRSLTVAARDAAAERGEALPDGKLPVRNRRELQAALRMRNRVQGHTPMEVRRYLTRRAKALDATDLLPSQW